MHLGNSIRSGTLWLFTGNIGQRSLEFLFGIILARLLLPADFGLMVMTQVFTGFAGFVAGGGMGQALIQSKMISASHFRVVFTLQLLICSIIYSTFYHGSPYIAIWLDNPIYIDLIRVSTLNFLIRPFVNISRAKLSRDMRFKSIALISLITMIISSSSSIYFAMNHFGVWSLVYGGLIGSVLSALLFLIHSRTLPFFTYNRQLAKQLGGYGIKFSINDIIEYLRRETPNFMIGKMLDSSTVGLFNKGVSTSAIPLQTIAGSAYQTVFRALSSTQDNIDKSQYIYLRTVTLVTVYTFPFYIGLIWVSESFILSIYGPKWQLASIPLQIFSVSRLFSCLMNTSGAVLAARNRLGIEITLQFFALILTALGCWYGIKHNDLTYICLGIIPGIIFLSFSMSSFAIHELGVKYKDFFYALYPAILLNLTLFTILVFGDYCLNIIDIKPNSIKYLLYQSGIGSTSYFLLFLFCPIKQLRTESDRWKKLLRIPSANIA